MLARSRSIERLKPREEIGFEVEVMVGQHRYLKSMFWRRKYSLGPPIDRDEPRPQTVCFLPVGSAKVPIAMPRCQSFMSLPDSKSISVEISVDIPKKIHNLKMVIILNQDDSKC